MIGNYGSGKSELALNFAFKAAETGKTELIDLDLVNTYFRLTERGKLVEQKEIRLISPNYACSGVETLSLPAEVASAFAMNWDTVVFDVGGDAVGSTALGRYYEDFQDFMAMGPEQLEVLNVVNIRRPLAGTVEKIIDLQQQMEIHSHLKITGMINNTNLATMTTPAELRDGYEMLREVSDRTGVPVMYTTGKKEMLDILRRVSVFSSNASRMVELTKKGMFMEVKAQDEDFGLCATDQVFLASSECDDDFYIAFSIPQLQSCISALPTDVVRMQLLSKDRAAVLTPDEPAPNILTLNMPMLM